MIVNGLIVENNINGTKANRQRTEIMASMLQVAVPAELKTHIMYKANLSHGQLVKYLAFLEENGLVESVIDGNSGCGRYKTTEKGIQFLKDYNEIRKRFSYMVSIPK